MLNWRRNPDDERPLNVKLSTIEPIQIEGEGQIQGLVDDEIEQIRKDTERIKKNTEWLKREDTKGRAFSALIKRHRFPDESNGTPIPPLAPDASSC